MRPDEPTRIIAGRGRQWLLRTFWLILFAAHLPLLFIGQRAADSDGWALLRSGTLALSLAFFLLKAADVRWLRAPNRRVLIASIVGFGLLHAEVVRQGTASGPMVVEPPMAVLATGALTWLAILPRLLARRAGQSERGSIGRRLLLDAWRGLDAAAGSLTQRLQLVRASCGNRAPPALLRNFV